MDYFEARWTVEFPVILKPNAAVQRVEVIEARLMERPYMGRVAPSFPGAALWPCPTCMDCYLGAIFCYAPKFVDELDRALNMLDDIKGEDFIKLAISPRPRKVFQVVCHGYFRTMGPHIVMRDLPAISRRENPIPAGQVQQRLFRRR